RRGGFTLPRPGVNDDEAPLRNGFGHAAILNCLAPLHSLRIRLALGSTGVISRRIGFRHTRSPCTPTACGRRIPYEVPMAPWYRRRLNGGCVWPAENGRHGKSNLCYITWPNSPTAKVSATRCQAGLRTRERLWPANVFPHLA